MLITCKFKKNFPYFDHNRIRLKTRLFLIDKTIVKIQMIFGSFKIFKKQGKQWTYCDVLTKGGTNSSITSKVTSILAFEAFFLPFRLVAAAGLLKQDVPLISGFSYSLINMRQLQICSIKPKLGIGLFVDLAEFPCFYQSLHDVIIKLFCRSKRNNFMITSCKNW